MMQMVFEIISLQLSKYVKILTANRQTPTITIPIIAHNHLHIKQDLNHQSINQYSFMTVCKSKATKDHKTGHTVQENTLSNLPFLYE